MTTRVRNIKQAVNTNWKDVLENFILAKKAQGLAERTINDYRYHISNLFKDSDLSLTNYEAVKLLVLHYFAGSSDLAPITFNTRLKTLKVFFKYLVSEKIIPENPITSIKKRKEDNKPRAVDEETLKKLLSLPDLTKFSGMRDYCLILLTLDTGIRPSESFGLKMKDFNLKSFEVRIPANVEKTRVSRTLPLNSLTVEAIKKLQLIHHSAWGEEVPLFCSENGTQYNSRGWSRRLKKYSREIGVSITPYTLRHSFALIFLRLGGNSFALQRELGHTTLTMTKRYVALTESDLKQQHFIASPLNSLVTKKNRVRNIKIF
jgi:site-specific recombinase XerD